MQRREPHIIEHQEFENLQKDCRQFLEGGETETATKKLKNYFDKKK